MFLLLRGPSCRYGAILSDRILLAHLGSHMDKNLQKGRKSLRLRRELSG